MDEPAGCVAIWEKGKGKGKEATKMAVLTEMDGVCEARRCGYAELSLYRNCADRAEHKARSEVEGLLRKWKHLSRGKGYNLKIYYIYDSKR